MERLIFATRVQKIYIMEPTMQPPLTNAGKTELKNGTNKNVLWFAESIAQDCLEVTG